VLHAIAGEYLDPAIVELHRNIHGNFLGGAAQHLAHAIVEIEPVRGLVKARFGSKPRIGLLLGG
jgi:hypothetical protein